MSREEQLSQFAAWVQQNITGDEKGHAQIFLDRLFQAFGQPGVLDVGGQTEFRLRKAAEDGGGTAFADLVWKSVVLVEMKKRGTDLQKHYRQAFDHTPESVFDTFPCPQCGESREAREGGGSTSQTSRPSRETISRITAVAAAARELRRVRAEALPKLKGGLRALYRTLELPGANPLKDAHAALDAAVLTAYGFSAKKDLLAQLLELNLAVAQRIEQSEPVTPPGIPANFPTPETLTSDDCIRAQ
jgi:hypothetical protein